MNLVPQRHSLLSESTKILRDAVNSGEFGEFLPGERKLCEQMQIGRDTLRLAIQQLEREELLAPGEPGKRRRILSERKKGSKSKGQSRTGVIVYLSPYPLRGFSSTALLEIDVLRQSLGKSGYNLEILGSPAFAMRRPGKILEKLVAERKPTAWVLHQSTAPMQQWFFKNAIPCVLHGQPQEGVDLPSVDVDYKAVARHVGGYLIRLGHRRVVMLRPADRLRGLEMAESGLREAFANHVGERLNPPLIAHEGPDKSSLIAKLADVLRKSSTRPTALVATRTRQIQTTISWLAQQGLSVPKDLSVVALDSSPNLDYFVPDIACYQVDPEQVAKTLYRKILEVAGSGTAARSPQPLMPEFFPGGSVAKIS